MDQDLQYIFSSWSGGLDVRKLNKGTKLLLVCLTEYKQVQLPSKQEYFVSEALSTNTNALD